MTAVNKSALVPFTATQMYELVADVDAYPEFLPWCRSVQVHARSPEEVRATIEMAKGPLHKSFTTVNRMTRDQRMELSLVEGPFRHLEGLWLFQPLGEAGSKVSMEIDFEFSSRLLTLSIGPVFNEIANRLVEAFVERARQVYGKR